MDLTSDSFAIGFTRQTDPGRIALNVFLVSIVAVTLKIIIMRSILFFLATAIFLNTSHAQSNNASLTVQAGFPTAEYKKNYSGVSSGMLFSFTHQLKNQPPFSFGAQVGIMQVNGADKYYTGFYNNEFNTFLVASWNHIVTLGAIFKLNLFPENNSFDVNINIALGTNIFITNSTISRDKYFNPITNTAVTKYYYSDTRAAAALRAGGGLGIEIPLGQKKNISIISNASYLYGTKAKYYVHPTIINTQIILSPRQSGTSMLLGEIGIRFGLFNKNPRD